MFYTPKCCKLHDDSFPLYYATEGGAYLKFHFNPQIPNLFAIIPSENGGCSYWIIVNHLVLKLVVDYVGVCILFAFSIYSAIVMNGSLRTL